MTPQDFFFSLEFSSQGVPAGLLDELAVQVLGHVGSTERQLPGLADALREAVSQGSAGQRRCDVQFRMNGRTLEVVVSANGGRIWQTSRAIT